MVVLVSVILERHVVGPFNSLMDDISLDNDKFKYFSSLTETILNISNVFSLFLFIFDCICAAHILTVVVLCASESYKSDTLPSKFSIILLCFKFCQFVKSKR